MQEKIIKTEPARSLKLTIHARPASKKNSRRVFVHKYTHRVMNLPSQAYDNFRALAMVQLKPHTYSHSFKPFANAIKVDYVFYRKGKLKQDISNAMASIEDVLQDAGIIVDDELIQEGSFKRYSGCTDWKTEITIQEL